MTLPEVSQQLSLFNLRMVCRGRRTFLRLPDYIINEVSFLSFMELAIWSRPILLLFLISGGSGNALGGTRHMLEIIGFIFRESTLQRAFRDTFLGNYIALDSEYLLTG